MKIYEAYQAWRDAEIAKSCAEWCNERDDLPEDWSEYGPNFRKGWAVAKGWKTPQLSFDDYLKVFRERCPQATIDLARFGGSLAIYIVWGGLNLSYYDNERLCAAIELIELMEMKGRMEKFASKKEGGRK